LIICARVMTVTTVAGQTGLKGGANFSNLYVDEVDDENVKIAYNIGFYHRAEITEFLSIQPELFFTSKGAELNYNNVFGSGNYRFNLNYLELPILVKLNVGTFNVHAGPYAAFLVGANIKDVDDNGNIQSVESLDRDDFQQFDYGMSLGAGFDFEGGQLGARYDFGMREIGSDNFGGESAGNAKNSTFMLYVGFDF
ncbi:MAG: porin family protein, partial [Cyclobacteriaceae bacterium]